MGITPNDLERAFSTYSSDYGGVKEDYFGLLYLSNEFGKKPEEIGHQVAFGGNDYGVDGFYIDKERRNLYLFQFKWTKDYNQFKGSLRRLIDAGMERIFGNPLQDQNQNEVLIQLRSQLNENQSVIDRVLVRFIFNGDPDAAEHSAALLSLGEDLENKGFLLSQYFKRDVDLTLEYRSNETKRLATAAQAFRTHEYTIPFQHSAPFETADDSRKLIVGYMGLMDLYGMYKEMGYRFLERNIRAGLSSDRAPNKAIRSALSDIVLKGSLEPEVFTFNHNGVTLAVQDIQFGEGDGMAKIVEPRLLNGAQTLTSVSKFLQDNDSNPGLAKGKGRLDSIKVLTKIVRATGPKSADFITEVTIYNNKQNKVDAWNLRANDQVQLDFQDKFRDDLGMYYERQEATFEGFRESDLEEMGITQAKAIEMKRLAYTFLASQGEIDRMSRLGEVFENTKYYDDTFRRSYLDSKSDKIVLAYKVQFRLNKMLDEIVEKGQNKYGFVMNARNLIWALAIQGIMNRDDFDQLSEEYGKDLSVTKNLTGILRELASRKIRFVVGKAVQDKEYQELLAKEKFSFLRTKSMFQTCMDIASRREGWSKKYL